MNEWQLKINLDSSSIEKVEEYIKKKLPLCMKEFLVESNAGYPKKDLFIIKNKEYVINNILNFNENSEESFYHSFNNLKDDINGLFPFAKDGMGNYYLLDIDSLEVYFFDHEQNSIEFLTDFNQMLNSLR